MLTDITMPLCKSYLILFEEVRVASLGLSRYARNLSLKLNFQNKDMCSIQNFTNGIIKLNCKVIKAYTPF